MRRRLGICLGAVALGACVSWSFADQILAWLQRPAGALAPRLAFFSPTEALGAYLHVAVAGGVALAVPVMLHQIWRFVRSGLAWRERVAALAFVWCGSLLFALGVWFAYAVCLPLFLRFLLAFGRPHLEPVLSVSRYLSFVLGMLLTCGALFELPLVIVLLTRLGILMPESMQRHRGAALVVLLTVAAVLTPTTDAVSLLVMTLPLAALYELSLLVASFVSRA